MKNYVAELRKSKDPLERELAEYLNLRLIITNKTIFEYVPGVDGIRNDYLHLLPTLVKLIEAGYFDGN